MVKLRCDKKRKLTQLPEKLKPGEMKTIQFNYNSSNGIVFIIISHLLSNSLQAQSCASKRNGTWISTSTWHGVIEPTNGNIYLGTIIDLRQIISYHDSKRSNKESTYTLCINTLSSVKNYT